MSRSAHSPRVVLLLHSVGELLAWQLMLPASQSLFLLPTVCRQRRSLVPQSPGRPSLIVRPRRAMRRCEMPFALVLAPRRVESRQIGHGQQKAEEGSSSRAPVRLHSHRGDPRFFELPGRRRVADQDLEIHSPLAQSRGE